MPNLGGDRMKLRHIYHSGFLVEINNNILIFDCLDPSVTKYFSPSSKVYVFTSHSHSDHYSKMIFDWEKEYSQINYILSDDIQISNKGKNYYFMDKYESLNVDNLKIQSFGSTDKGVSFLVSLDGVKIFHAGDLNWWHWKNDSPKAQKKEEEDFKYEVGKLIGKDIDVAFIPVDPRLEEEYYLGAEYFAKTINPRLLVPMHFSDDFTITKKVKEKLINSNVQILAIKRRNQEFDICLE